MKHTLSAYTALLEERGLLAAPLPETLDRSAPVELVSYDSREVAPGTLFDKLPEGWACPECAEGKDQFIQA